MSDEGSKSSPGLDVLPREIRDVIYSILLDENHSKAACFRSRRRNAFWEFMEVKRWLHLHTHRLAKWLSEGRDSVQLPSQLFDLRGLILTCKVVKYEVMETYARKHQYDLCFTNIAPSLASWANAMLHIEAIRKLKAFRIDCVLNEANVVALFTLIHQFSAAGNAEALDIRLRHDIHPASSPDLEHPWHALYNFSLEFSTRYRSDDMQAVGKGMVDALKVRATELADKPPKWRRGKARA